MLKQSESLLSFAKKNDLPRKCVLELLDNSIELFPVGFASLVLDQDIKSLRIQMKLSLYYGDLLRTST
jgi:hypothetical protein